MKKENLILIGGGGHCKSCIDVIESTGRFSIYGILDVEDKIGNEILGYKIVGTDSDIQKFTKEGFSFLITAGQIKTAKVRQTIYNTVKVAGGKLATVIANTAHVSSHASIGEGSIIMHNTLINADAVVGNNCIINSAAIVEHDVIIGDHVHISTTAVVNGNCKIDNDSFIGSNAVIAQGVQITGKCIIGAGCVVIRNISESGTYAGNPFKKIG